jgi:hypothetical protein
VSAAPLEAVAEDKKDSKEEKHPHTKKEDKKEAIEEIDVEVKEEKA